MDKREADKLLSEIKRIVYSEYTGKIEIDMKEGGDIYYRILPKGTKIKDLLLEGKAERG